MKGYPAYFKKFIYSVLVLLSVSGVVLIPSAVEMRLEWSVPWSLSGAPRIGVHAVHATAAFLALFIVGSLWVIHIRAGMVRRENLLSGFTMVALFVLLLLSGLGIYYAGEESLGSLSVGLHLIAGLLLPAALVGHIVVARQVRNGVYSPKRKATARGTLAWGREG